MTTKRPTPSRTLMMEALRWKKFHCTQLEEGRCPACTRLWQAIAKLERKGKRK